MVDVSVRVRKGRIYPMAWSSNGPESSLVHVVVFFAKHFRILVSFRARSLGHRSIGIRPPHTWLMVSQCLAHATPTREGERTYLQAPVIDMEPPQH